MPYGWPWCIKNKTVCKQLFTELLYVHARCILICKTCNFFADIAYQLQNTGFLSASFNLVCNKRNKMTPDRSEGGMGGKKCYFTRSTRLVLIRTKRP